MKKSICLLSQSISVGLILVGFMIFVPLAKNIVPEYWVLLILGFTLLIAAQYHRKKKMCKLG